MPYKSYMYLSRITTWADNLVNNLGGQPCKQPGGQPCKQPGGQPCKQPGGQPCKQPGWTTL